MNRIQATLIAITLFAAPLPVLAQGAPLDRVQNLITTGRFTDAAAALDRWEAEFAEPTADVPAANRARAQYLRGVITTDARAAEDIFVGVVLSYPSSAVAPDALLRLGQGLLTNGEAQRAIAYLERLRRDYPGSDARETGMLWLARAQLAAGSATTACETARAGTAATADPNLSLLLDIEQERACGTAPTRRATAEPESWPDRDADRGQRSQPPVASPPVTRDPVTAPVPERAVEAPVRVTQPAPQGEFAVQSAAFRELRSAHVVAGQMRNAGLDVRVVSIEGSDIYRVRTGTFTTAGEAAATMQRVRDAGFAALLVNDVRNERLVRDAPH